MCARQRKVDRKGVLLPNRKDAAGVLRHRHGGGSRCSPAVSSSLFRVPKKKRKSSRVVTGLLRLCTFQRVECREDLPAYFYLARRFNSEIVGGDRA